jgi:hypothetical protein
MSLSPSGFYLSCGSAGAPASLLPHFAAVVVERVEQVDGLVRISVSARGTQGRCSRCGAVSSRVHSRYERRLDDAPVGGQLRRHCGLGLCDRCWQKHPDRPFVTASALICRLDDPPACSARPRRQGNCPPGMPACV